VFLTNHRLVAWLGPPKRMGQGTLLPVRPDKPGRRQPGCSSAEDGAG